MRFPFPQQASDETNFFSSPALQVFVSWFKVCSCSSCSPGSGMKTNRITVLSHDGNTPGLPITLDCTDQSVNSCHSFIIIPRLLLAQPLSRFEFFFNYCSFCATGSWKCDKKYKHIAFEDRTSRKDRATHRDCIHLARWPTYGGIVSVSVWRFHGRFSGVSFDEQPS